MTMMMTVAQQPTWVAQTLFTHPAMLQRTGCLYFSVPGTQGLCLLFPLGPIPHIQAVSEALGVAGSWGESCPLLGRLCSRNSSTRCRWTQGAATTGH